MTKQVPRVYLYTQPAIDLSQIEPHEPHQILSLEAMINQHFFHERTLQVN